MKKNNQGYTIVELIVVMAIIAVLISVISYSIGLVFRNQSREAASDFNAMLVAAKIATLSGEFHTNADGDIEAPELFLEYRATQDSYYGELYTVSDSQALQSEELGDGELAISYTTTSSVGVTGVTVPITTTINFVYDRETGALVEFNFAPTTDIQSIILDFGAGYTITIYTATGYQEMS